MALLPDLTLIFSLPLGCLIKGVMLSTDRNAFLVLFAELLQLFSGVLRIIHAQDNGGCRVATVQSADPAHQAVIEGIVL